MTPEIFIEHAVRGGWDKYTWMDAEGYASDERFAFYDPKAWGAVGKEMGWESSKDDCGNYEHTNHKVLCPECPYDEYRERQHRFLDSLQQGNDITSALANATI